MTLAWTEPGQRHEGALGLQVDAVRISPDQTRRPGGGRSMELSRDESRSDLE